MPSQVRATVLLQEEPQRQCAQLFGDDAAMFSQSNGGVKFDIKFSGDGKLFLATEIPFESSRYCTDIRCLSNVIEFHAKDAQTLNSKARQ